MKNKANWLQKLPKLNENFKNNIFFPAKITPIQALGNLIEIKYKIPKKIRVKKAKFRVGKSIGRSILRERVPKGDTTNWTYEC